MGNQLLVSRIAFILVSYTDRHKKRFAVALVYLRNGHFSSIIGRKVQLLAGHVKYLFQEELLDFFGKIHPPVKLTLGPTYT